MNWSVELDPRGNVHVRVVGYLDEEMAQESARVILSLFSGKSREIYIEAEQMKGYRRGARVLWQERLWQLRTHIPRVVLVGGNSVVRMSTSVIAMALGVPMFVKTDASTDSPGEDAPVARKRPRSASRPLTRPMTRSILGTPSGAKARARLAQRQAQSQAQDVPVARRRKREPSRPV